MNQVICPNCRTVTPAWKYCANCNAPIEKLLNQSLAKQPGIRRCKMDPSLHRLVQRVQNQGISKLRTASTAEDWVAVIAKVEDLDAFKALDNVFVNALIPPVSPTDDKKQNKGRESIGTIVTARMPVKIVEDVRDLPFVYSLKAGQRVRPWLENIRRETRADVVDPNKSSGDQGRLAATPLPYGDGGKGVIVGIVDFGMDFMHKNFRTEDGKSRILALWDQTAFGDPRYEKSYGYGRVYTQADLNKAIEVSDLITEDRGDAEKVCAAAYQALGYEPPADSVFQVGAHGTYVADVAVGNGRGTGIAGLSPNADIIFVEVSTLPGAPALGQSFGDSAQLLEAITFIFDCAADRPCVVNLSLGTNGGPHDGSTLVEEAIDRLLSDPHKPNRAVVVAAGNAFGQNLHARGKVRHGESVDLKWRIPRNDATPNELEIWYSKGDLFTVEVIDPHGNSLAAVAPGWQADLSDNNRGLLTVVNRLDDPNNRDNTINIFFERGLQAGIWTLRIHGTDVSKGDFHAWIERDETGQARFVAEKRPKHKDSFGVWIDDNCTLSSIACGKKTIVVGSFDAHLKKNGHGRNFQLSRTTSAGPTRDKRTEGEKPDIAAPGELVMAARSRTLVLRNHVSGTSISAAAVTGIVALMMAEAAKNGATLTAEKITGILRATALKDVLSEDHRTRIGAGRVSANDALLEVVTLTSKAHRTKKAVVTRGLKTSRRVKMEGLK